jgi:hypothetical protein
MHVVFEAKKTGWPHARQLQKYARTISDLPGRRILCPLGVPPVSASPVKSWDPGGGIVLRHLRWIDVLRIVLRAHKRDGGALLGEYARLVKEVIGMQVYDREVLVRDVKWGERSFELFFRHCLYNCQASEVAEPLFFAPCFSGKAEPIVKGVHYFSRVYYKSTFAFGDRRAAEDALGEAEGVIRKKLDVLSRKRRAADQIKYLTELPQFWKKGVETMLRWKVDRGEQHAVFFLGKPMPLPRPVFKRGKMIPVGFSMTLEQLISGTQAEFKC